MGAVAGENTRASKSTREGLRPLPPSGVGTHIYSRAHSAKQKRSTVSTLSSRALDQTFFLKGEATHNSIQLLLKGTDFIPYSVEKLKTEGVLKNNRGCDERKLGEDRDCLDMARLKSRRNRKTSQMLRDCLN